MRIQHDAPRNRVLLWPTSQADFTMALRLPSRRWMKKARCFVVPLHRQNAMEVSKCIEGWGAPPEVVEAVLQAAFPPKSDRKFPDWYAFKTAPRSHQREAIRKLYPNNAMALFMDMGTGKSKTVIDIATAAFYERRVQCAIVVCPLSVKSQWWHLAPDGRPRGQIETHCPSPYTVEDFNKTRRITLGDGVKFPFYLVGIESLSQGTSGADLLREAEGKKAILICDESSRIKNPQTIRTDNMVQIGRVCEMRAALTGTPIVKNLIDMYSQFDYLDPDIIGIGDYYAFRKRYAIMGGYKNKEIVGYDNVEELMGMIEPYTYQCKKSEVLDLPPKIKPPPRMLQLSKTHADFYRLARQQKIEHLSTKNVLEKVLRLQQIVGGYVPNDKGEVVEVVPPKQNVKLQEVCNVIDETSGQVVIWARFIPEIVALQTLLRSMGHEPSIIVGADSGVPRAKEAVRAEEIRHFQEGNRRFIIGTQQSGGAGIELTAASLVMYYSNTQSLEDRLQSEDRAHRDGLKHSVTYVDLTVEKTVEVLIMQSILEKKDLADYVAEKLRESFGRASVDALLDMASIDES